MMHILSIYFKCFGCFRGMLQVFYTDVAKIDRIVTMVVHVCCKRLSPMFHIFSRRGLQVCLSRCCICFTHMLQLFYLDVTYVCNVFHVFQMFQRYVASVSCRYCKSRSGCCKCFRDMLQAFVQNVSSVFGRIFASVFYLYVANVSHMLQ